MSLPQAKLSDVIDVRHPGPAPPGAPSSTLAKTPTLEVRRLVLARGQEVPTHQAPGEITVYCLGADRVHRRRHDARAGGGPDARPGRRGAPFARRPGGLVGARHEGSPRQPTGSLRGGVPHGIQVTQAIIEVQLALLMGGTEIGEPQEVSRG
jgi:hypothetical protein